MCSERKSIGGSAPAIETGTRRRLSRAIAASLITHSLSTERRDQITTAARARARMSVMRRR